MKRISNILFISLFIFVPSVVLAHTGHHGGPGHYHWAEISAAIVTTMFGLIMFVKYRHK